MGEVKKYVLWGNVYEAGPDVENTYVLASACDAVVAERDALRAVTRWIPVTKALPEECTKVLASFDDSYGGCVVLVSREGDKWFDESIAGDLHEVSGMSHWMPVPAPHDYDKDQP